VEDNHIHVEVDPPVKENVKDNTIAQRVASKAIDLLLKLYVRDPKDAETEYYDNVEEDGDE